MCAVNILLPHAMPSTELSLHALLHRVFNPDDPHYPDPDQGYYECCTPSCIPPKILTHDASVSVPTPHAMGGGS